MVRPEAAGEDDRTSSLPPPPNIAQLLALILVSGWKSGSGIERRVKLTASKKLLWYFNKISDRDLWLPTGGEFPPSRVYILKSAETQFYQHVTTNNLAFFFFWRSNHGIKTLAYLEILFEVGWYGFKSDVVDRYLVKPLRVSYTGP